MNFFSFNQTKAQTKLFVSELERPISKGFQKGSHQAPLAKGLAQNTLNAMVEIAPDLIEEGLKVISSTIAGLSQDYTSETILRKNIDGDEEEEIFIPKHLTIVRTNFKSDVNEEKRCRDNFGGGSACQDLEDEKLLIELDIISSDDNKAFYFQPKSYFYNGKDSKGKPIHEITLYFAFVEATKNITDYDTLTYQKIITFKDLTNNHRYLFKQKDRSYDTTYQSAWISSEAEKKGAYTIVLKVEEKRYSSKLATTINKIYKKHENTLKAKINKEIKEQLEKKLKN
jgi:hypothetical protein